MSFGIFDVAKDFASGQLEMAPRELQRERLDICNDCPLLSKLRQCKECGCFVDAKVRFLKSECPIKKW